MTATVSHRPGAVAHYSIRDGWAWANINVRPFIHSPLGEGGVEVLINSDYGVFGYCWSHIGRDDWRAFLASLHCDYAMGKLAGQKYHVDAGVDDVFGQMKARLVEDVRERGVFDDRGDNIAARHRAQIAELRERIDYEGIYSIETLDDAWREVTGRQDWIGDWRLQVVNPQITGFWRDIWTPFADHLRQSMAAEAA